MEGGVGNQVAGGEPGEEGEGVEAGADGAGEGGDDCSIWRGRSAASHNDSFSTSLEHWAWSRAIALSDLAEHGAIHLLLVS